MVNSQRQQSISRRRRHALLFAASFLIVAGTCLFALGHLGLWLQIDEPLQRASAIVVLGGGVPFRAMEAAKLYRQGWGKEVWVTQASMNEGDRVMVKLGIHTIRDFEYSQMVLEKLGVPPTAVRLVGEAVDNTVAELGAINRYERSGGVSGPVILVTSKYHTRRVRVIWNAVARDRRVSVVRYSEDEKYEAGRWWSTSTDALATFREGFGILNAWAGFPIAPRER
jgi:uncharacterized SAM-binding protein YcdF (DUF218 family)